MSLIVYPTPFTSIMYIHVIRNKWNTASLPRSVALCLVFNISHSRISVSLVFEHRSESTPANRSLHSEQQLTTGEKEKEKSPWQRHCQMWWLAFNVWLAWPNGTQKKRHTMPTKKSLRSVEGRCKEKRRRILMADRENLHRSERGKEVHFFRLLYWSMTAHSTLSCKAPSCWWLKAALSREKTRFDDGDDGCTKRTFLTACDQRGRVLAWLRHQLTSSDSFLKSSSTILVPSASAR